MHDKKSSGIYADLGDVKNAEIPSISLYKEVFCPLNKYRGNTILTAVKSRRFEQLITRMQETRTWKIQAGAGRFFEIGTSMAEM